MQVTHKNDHVTHAVIGGADAIEFGMSNSAEFFHILSSTLYKDQKLAVVREVLCNAWDAHIESGKTDVPVIVTMTDEKLVVKDAGTGIHRDDIGHIYGVYGNSTKKNDGMQTGGFGLGCKAPFAYTEHFEVISAHEGVRTIYNLSKSSAQAHGKPGIVPIASFPTEDTGLQVTIPMKVADVRRFRVLINRIAKNGDMNIVFNGDPIQKLGFDSTKSNYMITQDMALIDDAPAIMLRYGNVIYPIDKVADLYDPYDRIEKHLNKLSFGRADYRIIFQAPPHSITVQPSREGLSMQERTVNTLRTLMLEFLNTLDTKFLVECSTFAKNSVDAAVKEVRIPELLINKPALPLVQDDYYSGVIADLGVMARRYMVGNYPDTLEFRKQDISYRLLKMVDANLLERGVVQTWLAAMAKVQTNHGHMMYSDTDWLQKRVLGPLVLKMIKAGVDYKRLYAYDASDRNSPKSTYGSAKQPIVPVTQVKPQHHFTTLPYLRKIVVLHRSRVDITTRAYKHDTFKKLGMYEGFLFYHVGMRKNEKDSAEAFFKAQGFNVVDLTIPFSWENTKRMAPVKTEKKEGLPTLSNALRPNHQFNVRYTKDLNAKRIDNPEVVMVIPMGRHDASNRIFSWSERASMAATKLFGHKIGVAPSHPSKNVWMKKGAVDAQKYVTEKVFKVMTTDPVMQEFWAFNPVRVIEAHKSHGNESLIRVIYSEKKTRDAFGIINNLTAEHKEYLAIWEGMVHDYRYGGAPPEMLAVDAHLQAIPLNQVNLDLIEQMKQNPYLDLFSTSGLHTMMRSSDQKAVDKAIAMLKLALNK